MNELEIHAKLKREFMDTCVLAFTETWLSERDQDSELTLTGFGGPIRLDRDPEVTRKSRGGGVCFFVNQKYCNTVVIRETICTEDIVLLSISLHPFYLPREFQQLFYTLVYIHTHANVTAASQLIRDIINKQDKINPELPNAKWLGSAP